MGIDRIGLNALRLAKRNNVSFAKTMMIGRQFIYTDITTIEQWIDSVGPLVVNAQSILETNKGFAEPIFSALGAQQIDSLDASSHEHATVIHDMNMPVPESLAGLYNTVFDGGSLEHIFNFPTAIDNCIRMIANGGHFISVTPTNNQCGHGFYQFSPELFYRVFSPENGFKTDVYFVSEKEPDDFYHVSDPKEARNRVMLSNFYASFLVVVAHKVDPVRELMQTPQQSDYEQLVWKNLPLNYEQNAVEDSILRKLYRQIVPLFIRQSAKEIREIKIRKSAYGTGNKQYFHRIEL